MNKFHYGENLRKVRMSKGLSQEWMASRLNISQKSYSRKEHQKEMPSLEEINKIAQAAGAEPSELMPPVNVKSSPQVVSSEQKLRNVLNSPMILIVVIPAAMIFVDYVYIMALSFCEGYGTSERTAKIVSFIVGFVSASYLGYLIYRFIKTR